MTSFDRNASHMAGEYVEYEDFGLTEKDLNELCPHHEGTATYSVWMNGARTVLSELAILRKAQE